MPAIVRAFCFCAARGGAFCFFCPAARVACRDPPKVSFTKEPKNSPVYEANLKIPHMHSKQ